MLLAMGASLVDSSFRFFFSPGCFKAAHLFQLFDLSTELPELLMDDATRDRYGRRGGGQPDRMPGDREGEQTARKHV